MKALTGWMSGEGRLSRKGYVLRFTAPLAAMALVSWLAFVGGRDFLSHIHSGVFIVPFMFFIATGDASNMQRWQDLGVSGAIYKFARPIVVFLPFGAMALQFILPVLMASVGDTHSLFYMMQQDIGGWSFGAIPLAMLGITAVSVIGNIAYLSLMPGQKGRTGSVPIRWAAKRCSSRLRKVRTMIR